ncbi:MAG TPA: phosphatase PAP2 family protein [Devosiaceae bacterium]|nr:phosphatase PAP2 family protein [Devosiaceae bacterium]
MNLLSASWPLGLDRRNWPLHLAGFVLVIVALGFLDHSISVWAHGQSPEVLQVFAWITQWGEGGWTLYPSLGLVVVSAVLMRFARQRYVRLALLEQVQLFGFIFVGIGLPSLTSNILKRLIGRSRPELFDSVGTLGFHPLQNGFVYQSFPSGHTTTAFATAAVVGFLAPRWYFPALIYALAVLASRVVLGVHYPTDVTAGAAVGTIGAWLVRNYFAQRRWVFEYRPDGRVERRRFAATARLLRRRQPRAAM